MKSIKDMICFDFSSTEDRANIRNHAEEVLKGNSTAMSDITQRKCAERDRYAEGKAKLIKVRI